MKRREEKKIERFGDGATRAEQRDQLERWIRADPDRERHHRQVGALGRQIREAWTEGPPAPSPEYLIAALRPEMARVDRERAGRSLGARLSERFSRLLRPVPIAAVAAAAALLLAVVTSLNPPTESPTRIDHFVPSASAPAAMPIAHEQSFDSPTTIYDLAQGDSPVLIYEAEDGATVLWFLEDETVSQLGSARGWA